MMKNYILIRFIGNLPVKYLVLLRTCCDNGSIDNPYGRVELYYQNFLITIYSTYTESGAYSITELDEDWLIWHT